MAPLVAFRSCLIMYNNC